MSELLNNIKLLDVTLRDGGWTNNFDFSTDEVNRVISDLDQSGIEYIEIGLRNGSLKVVPNIGAGGLCHKDYLLHCRSLAKTSKLAVMFHPKNLQLSDFEEMRDCGINMVRMCFLPNQEYKLSFQAIEMAKKCDLELCVNILYASKYTIESLHQLVFDIAKQDPDVIYLADSGGSLTPEQVNHLFLYLQQECKVNFGFHGHDSLFLAQANNFTAIQCGVMYIDASLSGLGNGAGNLRMEGIVNLLRSQGCTRYNVPKILNTANYIHKNLQNTQQSLPFQTMIEAIFNLSMFDAAHLNANADIETFYTMAEEYAKNNASKY